MQSVSLVSFACIFAGLCCAAEAPGGSGWVVIPVNEYGALRSKAYPADRGADQPRVEATLTRVDYDLRMEGALAAGRATLTIDVLKDGWVRVPIPAGLLVSGATMQGQPVSLVPADAGGPQLFAVLPHKGRSTLVLDVAFPVVSTGVEQRLALSTGASGMTRASVALPTEDIDVTVTGGIAARTAPADWVAYARGNEPLTLAWRKKKVEERRVELPLRMRGSLTQLFGLGEDSTSLNAEVEIIVVQGAARQVRIRTPENVAINHVPGATIADWDVKDGELTVSFLEPVEGSVKFGVAGEARLAREGEIDIPMLSLVGVERESGGVAVEVIGAGEIKVSNPQGLDSAAAAELGQMVAARESPTLAAFRNRPVDGPRALRIAVARYAQQAVLTANIDEARYRALISKDGKTLVQARYAVRNNQRNFLRVRLPGGAVLWSCSVAGRPARPGRAADASLLVPLAKGRAGDDAPQFAVEVLYLASALPWPEKGRASLPLPAADLPISRTGLTVYYPPGFRVTPEPGAFRAQSDERPAAVVLADGASASAVETPLALLSNTAASAAQKLADAYRPRTGVRTGPASLPGAIRFPAIGPSLFLASELTEENKPPAVELSYQKEKGGSK